MRKSILLVLFTILLSGCSYKESTPTIKYPSRPENPTTHTDRIEGQYEDYKNSGGELDFFEWQVEILGYHPGVSDYEGHLVVYFLDGDGKIITYSLVNKGEPAMYNGGKPTKSEVNDNGTITRFVFSKWDKDFFNVQHNLVVHALFDADPTKYFEVKFEDYDGKLLSTQIIPNGGIPTAPESPTRERTKSGHLVTDYEFSGWDKPLDSISKPTTFKATYKETSWEGYTVTWLAPDGTVLKTGLYEKGANPIYMTEDGDFDPYYYDNNYNYIFDSWDKTITNISDDITIKENAIKVPLIYNGDVEDEDLVITDEHLIGILFSIANSYGYKSSGIVSYNGKRYELEPNGRFFERRPYEWHLVKKEKDKILVISEDIFGYPSIRVDFNELNTYLNQETIKMFADFSKILETDLDNSFESRCFESSEVEEPNGRGKMFLLSAKEYKENSERIKTISEHTLNFMTRSYCYTGEHFQNVSRDWEIADAIEIPYTGENLRPCVWFTLD